MTEQIDFKDRVAFVTGGANGIGLGLVRALLAEGCKVAMVDIRQDSLDAAMDKLDNQNVMPVRLDISDRDAFIKAVDQVEEELGPISILCNNAGVNLFQTIEDSTFDDWDWVMGVNLNGVINGVGAIVPRMVKRGGGGHIVNTASMASVLVNGRPGIYNTSKFAVRGLSESLRYSLADHGIGVSVLCPGLVKSYIYASDDIRPEELDERGKPQDPEFVQNLAGLHELGMEPDEVAEKVLRGIRDNKFYIFSHPEFKDEVKEVFAEIVAEFDEDEDVPEGRAKMEAGRRASYKEARDKAANASNAG